MDAFTLLGVLKLVVDYFVAHFDGIMQVLTALHALALAFINLTKTQDTPAYRAVELVAGVITEKAKQ